MLGNQRRVGNVLLVAEVAAGLAMKIVVLVAGFGRFEPECDESFSPVDARPLPYEESKGEWVGIEVPTQPQAEYLFLLASGRWHEQYLLRRQAACRGVRKRVVLAGVEDREIARNSALKHVEVRRLSGSVPFEPSGFQAFEHQPDCFTFFAHASAEGHATHRSVGDVV